ncbi:MAG: creatininase family protein [Sphaerochaetaceae bacterium]
MRLATMTWPAVQRYFEDHDMVLFALGSIECHGRHNPLGTDYLVPDHLVSMVEKQSDILVAPSLPYGSCDYFTGFPGTVSLGGNLLSRLLGKITSDLYQYGARKFVILNGHGGNSPAIEEVGYALHDKGALLAELNWWKMAGQINKEWAGGHGGAEETAAVMGINPAWVDASELSSPNGISSIGDGFTASGLHTQRMDGVDVVIPRRVAGTTENGWWGPDEPSTATKQWGDEMLEAVATYVVRFIERFKECHCA